MQTNKTNILSEIRSCSECAHSLPFPPKPILQYSDNAKIIVIGQAPSIKAHQTFTPWNDASGDRLRKWLEMPKHQFYDKNILTIIPMGFCYPGKGKSGDLPPRKECAPKWHPYLVAQKPRQIVILIGKYAQDYYLKDKKTLTERIKNWRHYQVTYLPLPHPSPRNNIWLKKHKWFEEEVMPQMLERIKAALQS